GYSGHVIAVIAGQIDRIDRINQIDQIGQIATSLPPNRRSSNRDFEVSRENHQHQLFSPSQYKHFPCLQFFFNFLFQTIT
ncbi:hypothetical protein L249_8122, partial [Ophiocordyceps polyrhachis-furcata BCC 54312]